MGGFSGATGKIYEGLLMIGVAALITHLIIWMHQCSKVIQDNLNKKIEQSIKTETL